MTTDMDTPGLPERIKRLDVTLSGAVAGELIRESTYVFRYARDDEAQPAVSLLLPVNRALHEDGDLFPSMEMNLPEGFLFQQIIEWFRKAQITKMHLLALMGDGGIGRVGFRMPGREPPTTPAPMDRATLLRADPDQTLFGELVHTYLATGMGVSGVQPKILVPSRATLAIPDLIVKKAGAAFPDLAANEFLCLSAARRAGIEVPGFALSEDAGLLVVDRFDLGTQGERLGFEDIAALMGLRVHDKLSNRKYHGSYERVAEVIGLLSSNRARDLAAFFAQLTLSVMVRNGDAHLKNFGLLYRDERDVRLAPLYDVVTTTVYTYERPGGFEDIDRTLALKWRHGRHSSRAYPTTDALVRFGREVCGVAQPRQVIERIADAMAETLAEARGDGRITAGLLEKIGPQWADGQAHAGRR